MFNSYNIVTHYENGLRGYSVMFNSYYIVTHYENGLRGYSVMFNSYYIVTHYACSFEQTKICNCCF